MKTLKVVEDSERDVPGRLRVTLLSNNMTVSSVNNEIRQEHEPDAKLRNEVFGYFPYETAVIDESGEVFVIKHHTHKNAALMYHTDVVERLLLGKEMDLKKLAGKAQALLIRKGGK